jgi:hypothetical protein
MHPHGLIRLAALSFSTLALVTSANTQAASDPTRPPSSAAPAVTGAVRPAAPAASSPKPTPEPPLLGSLQIGRDGASTALLDGQVVRVGDKVGNSTVTLIDSQGITLRGPKESVRILLLQGSSKVPSKSPNTGQANHNISPTVSAGGSKP